MDSQLVWARDPIEGYVQARISEIGPAEFEVMPLDNKYQKRICSVDDIYPSCDQPQDHDDNCTYCIFAVNTTFFALYLSLSLSLRPSLLHTHSLSSRSLVSIALFRCCSRSVFFFLWIMLMGTFCLVQCVWSCVYVCLYVRVSGYDESLKTKQYWRALSQPDTVIRLYLFTSIPYMYIRF